jgi:hypothetical protein
MISAQIPIILLNNVNCKLYNWVSEQRMLVVKEEKSRALGSLRPLVSGFSVVPGNPGPFLSSLLPAPHSHVPLQILSLSLSLPITIHLYIKHK